MMLFFFLFLSTLILDFFVFFILMMYLLFCSCFNICISIWLKQQLVYWNINAPQEQLTWYGLKWKHFSCFLIQNCYKIVSYFAQYIGTSAYETCDVCDRVSSPGACSVHQVCPPNEVNTLFHLCNLCSTSW